MVALAPFSQEMWELQSPSPPVFETSFHILHVPVQHLLLVRAKECFHAREISTDNFLTFGGEWWIWPDIVFHFLKKLSEISFLFGRQRNCLLEGRQNCFGCL